MPSVGSSRLRIFGSVSNARAMASAEFIPPRRASRPVGGMNSALLPAGRLVHEQQPGPLGEQHADLQPLLLAMRQRARLPAGFVRQAELIRNKTGLDKRAPLAPCPTPLSLRSGRDRSEGAGSEVDRRPN